MLSVCLSSFKWSLLRTTQLLGNSFSGGAGFNAQRCDKLGCHQLQWHYQVSCKTMAAGSPSSRCRNRVTAPAQGGWNTYRGGSHSCWLANTHPAGSGAWARPHASPELLISVQLLASAVPWMGGTNLSPQSLSLSYPAPIFGLSRGQQADKRSRLQPSTAKLSMHIPWLNSGTVLLTNSDNVAERRRCQCYGSGKM